MPKYYFEMVGTVEADDEAQAEEKIKAGVGLENIEITEGPDENPEEVIDEDEETVG